MKTTRGHRGMRSGISLVEMMIAVFLFGVITTIGFKYYKNYYDVTLASKQALVGTLVDQARQLSNAYDLYEVKKGTAPGAISDLYAEDIKIITAKPDPIEEITLSTDGWELVNSLDLNDANANDTAFIYKVTATTLDSADKRRQYCNVLNNVADSDWSFDALADHGNSGVAVETIGTSQEMYAKTAWKFKDVMCYTPDNSAFTFVFVKDIDPS
jgi:Tfp pilus assembly protein PilE